MIRIILVFLLFTTAVHAQDDDPKKFVMPDLSLKTEIASSNGIVGVLGIGPIIWPGDVIWIPTIGAEINFNNDGAILGPKLSLEAFFPSEDGCLQYILPWSVSRLSFYIPYDLNSGAKSMYLTPEVGLGWMDVIYVTGGYNIKLQPDSFSNIEGFRISIGLNIPLN